MRKKALELAACHNKPLIVTESLPGLDRHFCSISRSQIAIVAVIEPSAGSPDFVKALIEVCGETGSRLVVILNKNDIAPATANAIRAIPGIQLLLEIPWQSPEDVESAFQTKLVPGLIKFIESIR
jgi:MinD superfamily P-loop ATPase